MNGSSAAPGAPGAPPPESLYPTVNKQAANNGRLTPHMDINAG